MKRAVWMTDANTLLKIYELAEEENISLQHAFEKILEKEKSKIKFLGTTEKDAALLTGDLREEGYKVLNINEEAKKKEE